MIIGIIGSSDTSPGEDLLAREAGERLAKEGITIICGGLGGVMEASCKGARSAGGLTIGILPGILKEDANSYVDIAIPTGIGEARNLIIIRSSSSVIAIGGGYGTLSEIGFALKLGIPVVGLRTWEIEGITKAETAEEAVRNAIALAGLPAGGQGGNYDGEGNPGN